MSQNHVFTAEKQLFSRIYMHDQSYIFYHVFYVFCVDFELNYWHMFAYFWGTDLLIDFWCIFVQKRCPKSTKNEPKIDPSASQGGVWLPGSIRSCLDMPFLRFSMPKWHQKIAKNVVETPLAPRTIEISRFSPKCSFGGVLAPFCNFRRTYLT